MQVSSPATCRSRCQRRIRRDDVDAVGGDLFAVLGQGDPHGDQNVHQHARMTRIDHEYHARIGRHVGQERTQRCLGALCPRRWIVLGTGLPPPYALFEDVRERQKD